MTTIAPTGLIPTQETVIIPPVSKQPAAEDPAAREVEHLSDLNFQDIHYYVRASANQEKSWEDVPDDIRKTYDRLGIPEAEKKYLAGVKAQYESEVVYGSLQEDLAKQGVIFTDTDSALRDYPDLFREYFGTGAAALTSLKSLPYMVWT